MVFLFKLTSREQKLVVLLGGLLLLGIVLRFALPEENEAARVERDSSEMPAVYSSEGTGAGQGEAEETVPLVVHVTGHVVRPGVYDLEKGARVIDALEEAGGSLETADLERVNLAQPLIDGQQVYIPALLPQDEDGQAAVPARISPQGSQVNINTADQAELESLPGIGSVKARSIIHYREQHGLFQQVEDILQVSGIGEKTLESLKDQITVY